MHRPLLIAALLAAPLALPTASLAQDDSGKAPQRVRSVTLNRGQKCPPATSPDEVVVCSTLEEPFRIPRALRNDGPVPAANQSWANRTAAMDQTGRVAGGLPDTCSPVGTGGQSGCSLQRNQQWAAERRAEIRANESAP